jgi:hypothetical protein
MIFIKYCADLLSFFDISIRIRSITTIQEQLPMNTLHITNQQDLGQYLVSTILNSVLSHREKIIQLEKAENTIKAMIGKRLTTLKLCNQMTEDDLAY